MHGLRRARLTASRSHRISAGTFQLAEIAILRAIGVLRRVPPPAPAVLSGKGGQDTPAGTRCEFVSTLAP